MLNKFAVATIEKVFSPDKPSGKEAAIRAFGGKQDLPSHLRFDPDHVYTLVRAISARVNENKDGFRREELLGEVNGLPAHNDQFGYKTFIGKYNHIDHHNQPSLGKIDPLHIPRGQILHSSYHEDELSEPVIMKNIAGREIEDPVAKLAGKDCWVELLIANSRKNWPKVCQAIEKNALWRVSMGAEVTHSVCSVCGNPARHEFEYCEHIAGHRGAAFPATSNSPFVIQGALKEGELIVAFEDNRDLQFFEISWITDQQADPTAVLLDIVRNETPKEGGLVEAVSPTNPESQEDRDNEDLSPGDKKTFDSTGPPEKPDKFDYSLTPDVQPGEHFPDHPFPCSALDAAAKANPDYPMDTLINVEKCQGCMYNESTRIGAVDCRFPEVVREDGADPLPAGFAPPDESDLHYDASGFKNDDGTQIRVMPGLNPKEFDSMRAAASKAKGTEIKVSRFDSMLWWSDD